VAPLTPAEARRFDAGAVLYTTICAACHMADGRGEERIGPPLIGSPLVLASPGVAVRIVLHGKQGPVGVMPALGSALDDEQVASLLTYIRREWGQTGTPVDPAAVAGVRALTADRARPWTPEELAALTQGTTSP
jgi:mono/diheme cytochrome c family protein